FFGSLTQAGWLITLHAQWDGPTRRNDNDPECPGAIWRDPRHERRTHATCPPDREISSADGPACLGPDPWCSPAASGSVHSSRGSRGAAASGHHCTDRRPGCLPRGRQHEQMLRLPQDDLLNYRRGFYAWPVDRMAVFFSSYSCFGISPFAKRSFRISSAEQVGSPHEPPLFVPWTGPIPRELLRIHFDVLLFACFAVAPQHAFLVAIELALPGQCLLEPVAGAMDPDLGRRHRAFADL